MTLDQDLEVILIVAIVDHDLGLVQEDMGDVLSLGHIHDPGQDPEVVPPLSQGDKDLHLSLTSDE